LSRPFRLESKGVCIPDSQIANLNISTTISQCKIRSIRSPFECILCNENYSLKRSSTPDVNGLKTSCILDSSIDSSQDVILPLKISPTLSVSGPEIFSISAYPTNCELLSISSKSVFNCGKCLSSHSMQIIKGYSPATGSKPKMAITNLNPVTKLSEFFPSYPSIQACANSYTNFVKKTDNSNYLTNISDCLYAEELEKSIGMACLQCTNGRPAKVYTAEREKDLTDLGFQTYYTIGDCSTCPKDFTKEFHGLYSHIDFTFSSIGKKFSIITVRLSSPENPIFCCYLI
jgi:hypothetical protein